MPEEPETLCIIEDPREDAKVKKFNIKVRQHYTVAKLYEDVSTHAGYPHFELVIPDQDLNEPSASGVISLHNKKTKRLIDVGIQFGTRNTLHIFPRAEESLATNITVETEMSSDEELALGASASPVERVNYNIPTHPPPPPALLFSNCNTSSDAMATVRRRRLDGEQSQPASNNYRGLVNQAMTCYLNSLLQALFMTPEFRNALYNWEFDGKDEAKSIPYHLQKLFVNLQTSPKPSVETTDLTRSFGWDSADGWHQHDIQELCRVMFDALELKFKNTKQADLINRLYEGKMIDYVKCLECQTEKQREDKFLDIPLPVRNFGSTVAFESVEAALHAFVQPETLDGNNQYHCETCKKKCDAHKGLKFTKFPYILTLHLKRFDFDYNTLHRIKLNDKVTFPEKLNLNNFINAVPVMNTETCTTAAADSTNGNGTNHMETAENFMKTYDECSTTDSGSALEEDSSFHNGTSASSSTTTPNEHFITQDDDEGIDLELNGDSKSSTLSNTTISGPYVYELFAIMIHSGSASGGHYYAYIKDFNTSKWYAFNDQTVSPITQDDIQKSFGGSTSKTFYSGVYSTSTNAYMLMYRQIDSSKNALPIKEEEFPAHIKKLMNHIRDAESERKKRDSETRSVKVYFENPKTREFKSYKICLLSESTLSEVLEEAHTVLRVKDIVPIDRCRLVAYDREREVIEKSFEGMDDSRIGDVMDSLEKTSELLLETREDHEVFEPYLPDGLMTKVYKTWPDNLRIEGPICLRVSKTQTVQDFKKILARRLRWSTESILLALNQHKANSKLLDNPKATLKAEEFIEYCKVFVTENNPEDPQYTDKFLKFVSRLDHIIALYFVLPSMDEDTLKSLSIPRQSSAIVNGKTKCPDVLMVNNDSSEDSSLSDNDRTLVEDDTHSTVTNEVNGSTHFTNGVTTNGFMHDNEANDNDEEEEAYLAQWRKSECYFSVTPVEYHDISTDLGMVEDTSSSSSDSEKVIQVLIDKRASVGYLKYKLQSYLRISMQYFKLFKTFESYDELTSLNDLLNAFKDGDRLRIGLGRVLRKGEYKVNVYYLNANYLMDDAEKLPQLCSWIVRQGQPIGKIKSDILAHLRIIDDKYSNLTFDRCLVRKKGYNSISEVYPDNYTIGDEIIVHKNMNIILQEVDDLASVTPVHISDVLIMTRRWSPSQMKLENVREILFKNKTELKKVLSQLSGIPEENIEHVKLQQRDIPVLQIHTMAWRSDTLHPSELQHGNLIYYRDKTEQLRELTAEERETLSKKDIRSTSTYSPRKERALKIYVDASPKKADD